MLLPALLANFFFIGRDERERDVDPEKALGLDHDHDSPASYPGSGSRRHAQRRGRGGTSSNVYDGGGTNEKRGHGTGPPTANQPHTQPHAYPHLESTDDGGGGGERRTAGFGASKLTTSTSTSSSSKRKKLKRSKPSSRSVTQEDGDADESAGGGGGGGGDSVVDIEDDRGKNDVIRHLEMGNQAQAQGPSRRVTTKSATGKKSKTKGTTNTGVGIGARPTTTFRRFSTWGSTWSTWSENPGDSDHDHDGNGKSAHWLTPITHFLFPSTNSRSQSSSTASSTTALVLGDLSLNRVGRIDSTVLDPDNPDTLRRPTSSSLTSSSYSSSPIYRYTPILSGIIIPFSILLEIPGLTEEWYIRTEQHDIVERRENTAILDAALGISMACGVLANACLVGRFLEREDRVEVAITLPKWDLGWWCGKRGKAGKGKDKEKETHGDGEGEGKKGGRRWVLGRLNLGVRSMTLWCIAFLTIHDIINIATVTVFGVEHRFDDGFTYGPSFWMTLCSTIVSTITNLTLITDFIKTPNFAQSGSGLTKKQRSLVIIVILLLCYIALGALVNSFLLELTFINALYFTVVTIETIGFGDIHPTTTGSRIFTCIYAVLGILNLGLAISLTRETVLEALEVSYRLRVQRYRHRMKMRRRKKERDTWKKRVEERWKKAIEWRLKEKGVTDVWVPSHPHTHTHRQHPSRGMSGSGSGSGSASSNPGQGRYGTHNDDGSAGAGGAGQDPDQTQNPGYIREDGGSRFTRGLSWIERKVTRWARKMWIGIVRWIWFCFPWLYDPDVDARWEAADSDSSSDSDSDESGDEEVEVAGVDPGAGEVEKDLEKGGGDPEEGQFVQPITGSGEISSPTSSSRLKPDSPKRLPSNTHSHHSHHSHLHLPHPHHHHHHHLSIHPPGMKLNLEVLTRGELEAAALETGVDLETLLGRRYMRRRFGSGRQTPTGNGNGNGYTDGSVTPIHEIRTDMDDTPLTHARLGRMIRMLGNFALAVDKSFVEGPPPPATHGHGGRDGSGSGSGSGEDVDEGDAGRGRGRDVVRVPAVRSKRDVEDDEWEDEGEDWEDDDDDDEEEEEEDGEGWEGYPDDSPGQSGGDDPNAATNGQASGQQQPRISRSRKRPRRPKKAKPSLAQQYEAFRADMEKEEMYAFYTRFAVAWSLFIMFWMLGSVIFMSTEKWSFGIAMYFCFISFTTIGYGDLTPQSPAGRSVFVFWALLGVGTMTILISIVSEAYSDRYKHVIHSDVFEQAVRKYHERKLDETRLQMQEYQQQRQEQRQMQIQELQQQRRPTASRRSTSRTVQIQVPPSSDSVPVIVTTSSDVGDTPEQSSSTIKPILERPKPQRQYRSYTLDVPRHGSGSNSPSPSFLQPPPPGFPRRRSQTLPIPPEHAHHPLGVIQDFHDSDLDFMNLPSQWGINPDEDLPHEVIYQAKEIEHLLRGLVKGSAGGAGANPAITTVADDMAWRHRERAKRDWRERDVRNRKISKVPTISVGHHSPHGHGQGHGVEHQRSRSLGGLHRGSGSGGSPERIPGLDEIVTEIVFPPAASSPLGGEGSGVMSKLEREQRKAEKEMERSGRKLKREIMEDDAARQTLLVLSIEHALKRIMDVAEDALRERKKERAHRRRLAHMHMENVTGYDADGSPPPLAEEPQAEEN